jgi:hypothetical protein
MDKTFRKQEITGVPIKGIVNNIQNPFTVFTILYDFKSKVTIELSLILW